MVYVFSFKNLKQVAYKWYIRDHLYTELKTFDGKTRIFQSVSFLFLKKIPDFELCNLCLHWAHKSN